VISQIALLFGELKSLLEDNNVDDANNKLAELDKAIRELFNERQATDLSDEAVSLLTDINRFFQKVTPTLVNDAKTVQESLLKIKKADKVRKAYQL
jgi:hypothetical protein